MELLLILGAILVVLFFVFERKEKDKYIAVQERRTQVSNHVIKVPGERK